MNDTEQRIAIAKATGCNMKIEEDGFWVFSQPGHLEKFAAKHHTELEAWRLCAKNYTTDLNAMHEAENVLNEIQGCIFSDHLFRILNSSEGVSEFMKIHATAAQRAEAFLKTLNLWKP